MKISKDLNNGETNMERKATNSLDELQNIINDYEKRIEKLKIIENELSKYEIKGFETEIQEIKKYIKDPRALEKVVTLFSNFKNQIEKRNKSRELLNTLNNKINEFKKDTYPPSHLQKIEKEHDIIQTLFSEKKFNEMEEKVNNIILLLDRSKASPQGNRDNISIQINKKLLRYFPEELLPYYTPYEELGTGGFARAYSVIKNKDKKKSSDKNSN